MRMHFFQHVPFEDPAYVELWARDRNFQISRTRFCNEQNLPTLNSLDWLVILGGPMGAYDEAQYPWLKEEKRFIAEAVLNGKVVLGFCLGAQLLAEALGGQAYPQEFKEVGWYPVRLLEAGKQSRLLGGLPEEFTPLHWHGDTFDLPPGAINLARSAACEKQAFQVGDRVLGLQFHLEFTQSTIERLIKHCGNDLVDGGTWVMPSSQLSVAQSVEKGNALLVELLDRVLEVTSVSI